MSNRKPLIATQQQAQAREVEIKLEFDPADAARLAAHPLLSAPPQKQDLVSIYFDTPGETLHKAGVYLRIRDINGRLVQTIKTAKTGGGLLDRFEWERDVKGRTPNFSGAGRTALKPRSRPISAPRFARRSRPASPATSTGWRMTGRTSNLL